MKLFTTNQVKELDEYTIAHEPVSSINLMERASLAVVDWLLHRLYKDDVIKIIAGPGNNGGDALAVARLLALAGFNSEVFFINPDNKLSADCLENKNRLLKQNRVIFHELKSFSPFLLRSSPSDWLIDGLFGTGLNRPAEGTFAEVIQHVNRSDIKVVSIDMPSGLFGEDNAANNPHAIIKADYTLSFQFPKIAFLLPENEQFVGQWEMLDIKLHPEAINSTPSSYFYTDKKDVEPFLKPRSIFSHKGHFGHALFIGGSLGRIGAVILASRACLRSGVGLLTVAIPMCGLIPMQVAVPEAMCLPDTNNDFISQTIEDLSTYSAIGVGCGLGTQAETASALKHILQNARQPLVLDADALNILSENKKWFSFLPPNTIITPHPKEFERLTGTYSSRFEQIEQARTFADKYHIFVVLKGAYTAVVCPNGEVHFNSSGNAGMATAGSGDVLCGIILSLLAQGYPAKESAILGVYAHGEAGDIAAEKYGQAAVIASDIIY